MFANMSTNSKFTTLHKDIEKVLGKTAEDLAESLEIMMIETRPVGSQRAALRGACCILRKEVTDVEKNDALRVVRDLSLVWHEQHREARVLICKRAIEFIEGNA